MIEQAHIINLHEKLPFLHFYLHVYSEIRFIVNQVLLKIHQIDHKVVLATILAPKTFEFDVFRLNTSLKFAL